MTDDRSLERAARSWVEIGPTRAPERTVERALLLIETTPQERDLRIPRRLTEMSMFARLATATVLGVLAVGGVFYLLGRSPSANVGAPSPSPSASPMPSPTPSAPLSGPAPNGTLGDWQAVSDAAVAGLFGTNEHIQLSVDWQDGLHTWIQKNAGDQVVNSQSLKAPADEIDLLATAETIGCVTGDLGRYHWSRSADGMFLTLTVMDDACTKRAQAMSRTWVHSLSAVNDGGSGVYPIDGWLQATLPSIRWALGDVDLHTFDSSDPAISFVVTKDPSGFADPCASPAQTVPVPGAAAGGVTAVAAYAAFVRTLPGFAVKSTDAVVGGHPAVHLTLTPKAAFRCASGAYAMFHDGTDRVVTPGVPHSLWIIDVGGPTYAIWYEGAGVNATSEQAVISSLKFLDHLPTP
jgi:hypothetical protein